VLRAKIKPYSKLKEDLKILKNTIGILFLKKNSKDQILS